MKHLFVALLACVCLITATAHAQSPAVIAAQSAQAGTSTENAPSANDLQELSRLLADPRLQTWLEAQVTGAAATAPEAQPGIRAQFDTVVTQTKTRISDLRSAWGALGNVPRVFSERWRAQLSPAVQVRSLTFVLIFLLFGAGLEWLLRQYTGPIRKRIEVARYTSATARLRAGLYRTGLAFLGLFVFALGSIGAFSAFAWPPLLSDLILNALLVIVVTRAVGAMLLLFLAPRVPQLRLVPLSTPVARVLWWVLTWSTALILLAFATVDVFEELTAAPDEITSPESLALSVLAALLVLFIALLSARLCFGAIRKQHTGDTGRRSQTTWQAYLSGLSVAAFLLWLLGLTPLVWTVLIVGLLVPIVRLVSAWVHAGFDRATAEFLERNAPSTPPVEDDSPDHDPEGDIPADEVIAPFETYRPIGVRLARFAVIVTAGLALALVWNVGIFERTDQPSLAQQLFAILIDSAVAILIADLVWTWGKTAIDRRLAAYKPPEDGQAPGPEARMATLLPLLRVVLQITLGAMVIMSILAAAGVNIAPILAGASVLGIAIGFGAQSLVKDVVSGIFFLIDDAFRIGEYVEIDQLRGTVEKISIRSLQLRHHRGAVHTLPFGELKSLTNHSRDWVIMKLEFRVPFDTDLKLVKKLIKKVGADLKANEFYGDGIIETLKSQGVRRMEEFNMVVGVKFMTRPGEQWLVRRDAYQGVRDIFEANGIRMAERNVKVEIAGEEDLTEEQKKAASAAAQEASTQQGLPKPIPDEP